MRKCHLKIMQWISRSTMKFINPDLIFMLEKENQSAKIPNNVLYNQTPRNSQSVYGCTVC